MSSFYTHNQALRMYRKCGARVPVLLSPLALRKVRAQGRARRAGLAELAVASNPYMVRGTFQSEADFQTELLAMRTFAHTAQVHAELHN